MDEKITHLDLITNVIGKEKNQAIAWLRTKNVSYGRMCEDTQIFLFDEPGDVQLIIENGVVISANLKK